MKHFYNGFFVLMSASIVYLFFEVSMIIGAGVGTIFFKIGKSLSNKRPGTLFDHIGRLERSKLLRFIDEHLVKVPSLGVHLFFLIVSSCGVYAFGADVLTPVVELNEMSVLEGRVSSFKPHDGGRTSRACGDRLTVIDTNGIEHEFFADLHADAIKFIGNGKPSVKLYYQLSIGAPPCIFQNYISQLESGNIVLEKYNIELWRSVYNFSFKAFLFSILLFIYSFFIIFRGYRRAGF